MPGTSADTAFLGLVDALACCCQALQDPACMRLLGPVVPGATMAGGARVPGTSFELDPVQAAFNIGAMLGGQDGTDAAFGDACAHLADSLGTILAMMDYLSRKAVAEGKPTPSVRDLLAAMIKARRIQHACAAGDPRQRYAAATIAAATLATALLGGDTTEVARATSMARAGTATRPIEDESSRRWLLGDANSLGMRIALLAVAGRDGDSASWSGDAASSAACALQARNDDPLAVADAPAAGARVLARFEAIIAAHFPTKQAARIKALLDDRARLELTPVHEFLSILVRN